jgi:hypothetical protein
MKPVPVFASAKRSIIKQIVPALPALTSCSIGGKKT